MSPTALTATIAATIRPSGIVIDARPEPAFHGAAATEFPDCRAGAGADVSFGDGTVGRAGGGAIAAISGRPDLRLSTNAKVIRIAPGTIGTFAMPRLESDFCFSRFRRTPVATSRPNALPPDKNTAWTCWTRLTGSSTSVSTVPGADPRTSTPATAPASVENHGATRRALRSVS